MTMEAWLNNAAVWWLSFGIALLIAELFTGSLLFLFMGVATVLVALLVWLFAPVAWLQSLIFGVVILIALAAWWRFRPNPGDRIERRAGAAGLNNRMAGYIGREAVLEEAIVNGTGRIRLDDSFWNVRGDDMRAGVRVRVVGVDVTVLLVEAV